ncbi:DUF4855 domain-containing protein [Paenibacillus chungangensis]|uniref:DUF4855 domain-containing protein n=1 Tax=Paenibacillus chungangensis TaxID=696535 RepID=A0ABW3HLP4_9BACL
MRKFSISLLAVVILMAGVTSTFANEQEEGAQPASAAGPSNLALGKPYHINQPADPQYADNGNKLTDGIRGVTAYEDEAWVGFYKGNNRDVVIDLGTNASIATIKANFLQATSGGIQYPNVVSISVSNNGDSWDLLRHEGAPAAFWLANPPLYEYVWDGTEHGVPGGNKHTAMAYARYVKISFTTNVWVFLDEIEVLGYDGKVKGAKKAIAPKPEYLKPSKLATDDISDMVLLYNGHYGAGLGDWTKEEIIPYLSYVDEHGKPQDWMFDGVLYLGLSSPAGRAFEMSFHGSTFEDWQWYLNKTFAENGDMDQLNEAVQEVSQQLGKEQVPFKVVLMIPYPAEPQDNFGDVDGDGISENFNAAKVGAEASLANKKKAVEWYIDEALKRWQDKNYSHLTLSGLYWLNEEVAPDGTGDSQLIRFTSERVHDEQLKFYWIPRYRGYQFNTWQELGFDAVAYQPNHFFHDSDSSRIDDAAELAKTLGMGVEIEFDERINTDASYRQRLSDYLDGAKQHGYHHHTFRGYYQGNTALLDAARSDDPVVRDNYDKLYRFITNNK